MKRLIAFLVFLMFVFSFSCSSYAFGDPSSSALGAAIYGMMNGYGLDFVFNGMSASATQEWIESEVNKYSGGNPDQYFSPDLITSIAGKLIIPALVAGQINEFIQDRINNWGLNADPKQLTYTIAGLPVSVPPGSAATNIWSTVDLGETQSDGFWISHVDSYRYLYYGDTRLGKYITMHRNTDEIYGYSWYVDNNTWYWGAATHQTSWVGQENYYYSFRYAFLTDAGNTFIRNADRTNVTADLGNYDGVWSIGDDKVISIGSQDWGADTNLDQIIGDIYTGTANNDIDIDMEETDAPVPPTPAPTPIPVEPDTPLQDVPWQGLNDLIGQTEQGINQQIQSQTQSVTSAQEATTEAVESLTDTISDALDLPDAQELPDFKFDLRELFPFCIPFDIYRLLSSFDAEPQAPHVQLPIVIESIGFSYNLDLDFSAWNPVAQAMRTAELIVYAIGLAWATGKVIKW